MERFRTTRTFWLLLILAASLASFISLYIGLEQSVWFDEAYSILLAQHSWTEIVRLTAEDVHPPVYYWILKAWLAAFGSSELALRSMSALFLGLSIGVAGLLLRRLFGAKVALIALPFLVVAPFLLRYGFEIRMYALCSFIGIGATYILVAAIEEKKKKRRRLLFLAYALLVTIGVYTLYFMALLWIAHLVWVAWLAYAERRRGTITHALAAYAFAFLLFIPWLPSFLSKAGGGTLSAVTNQLDLKNLYGMATYLFLYRPPWEVEGMSMAMVAFIIAVIAYLGLRGYKNATKKERQYLVLLATYFFTPVLVLVVVTYFRPIYIERYMAHITIGLFACIGTLAALSLRKANVWSYAATGGLVVVLVSGSISLAQFGNYNFQRIHTPTVKEIAGLLSECENDAIIFADGPQVAMELMYYVTECPVYFFNETSEMGGGFAMLSGSPLRVADAADLPESKEVLHVYYDTPKRSVSTHFHSRTTETIGVISVAAYQVDTR